MAWMALAAAAAGALAGGQKDKKGGYQEGNSTSTVNLQNIDSLNQGRSALETLGDTSSMDFFKQLQDLLGQGPGNAEVQANNTFQNQYASQLQQLLDQGGGPTASMIGQANQFANAIYDPQQVALNQQFDDQRIQANRLAARLGRPGTDPVLQNKLIQEQTRQQTLLNSQRGAFAAQTAQAMPQQFMNVGGALSNLRQGLATQAFQNRQAMLTLGQQLTQAERNYRLQAAGRTNYNYQSNEDWSGGGFKGAVGGAFAGFGAGMAAMGPSTPSPGGSVGGPQGGRFPTPVGY